MRARVTEGVPINNPLSRESDGSLAGDPAPTCNLAQAPAGDAKTRKTIEMHLLPGDFVFHKKQKLSVCQRDLDRERERDQGGRERA